MPKFLTSMIVYLGTVILAGVTLYVNYCDIYRNLGVTNIVLSSVLLFMLSFIVFIFRRQTTRMRIEVVILLGIAVVSSLFVHISDFLYAFGFVSLLLFGGVQVPIMNAGAFDELALSFPYMLLFFLAVLRYWQEKRKAKS